MKKAREATLRRGKPSDWTDQLILDKDGKIIANLANLILILREAPKWRGVLGYDEFAARVVIRKRPPWGVEALGLALDRPPRSLARVWFQSEEINPAAGDVGRAVQAAARHNTFHPVRNYFDFARLGWCAATGGVARLPIFMSKIAHTSARSGRAF